MVYGRGGTYSAIRSRSFLIVPDLVWGPAPNDGARAGRRGREKTVILT
jgi:hypothetical protein